MKANIARFHVLAALSVASLLLPMHAGIAAVGTSSQADAGDEDCGNANAFYMAKTVVPSIQIRVCDDCRFSEADRHALQVNYGERAQDAGYIVDPLDSRVVHITETGMSDDGRPYLRAEIDTTEIHVRSHSRAPLTPTVAKQALTILAAGK